MFIQEKLLTSVKTADLGGLLTNHPSPLSYNLPRILKNQQPGKHESCTNSILAAIEGGRSNFQLLKKKYGNWSIVLFYLSCSSLKKTQLQLLLTWLRARSAGKAQSSGHFSKTISRNYLTLLLPEGRIPVGINCLAEILERKILG